MNDYYVYEWIRLDTNEPFYVGKGRDNRCYKLTRGNNQHFNNIVKSVPCAVNILHENLDEQMAFDLEVWYIREYRDVIGYDLVNISDGGSGHGLKGELNGMYGVHRCGKKHPMYGKHHSEETREKLRKYVGKNSSTARCVICITTKKIFESITEVGIYYKCCNSAIAKCCKKRKNFKTAGKLPNGTPLVWRYLVWKHDKKYRIKCIK